MDSLLLIVGGAFAGPLLVILVSSVLSIIKERQMLHKED